MKTFSKLFCLAVITAGFILTGCPTDETTVSGGAGRLDIWVGSTLYTGGSYAIQEEGDITVIVENFYAAATGTLDIAVGGQNTEFFSVSSATLGPIAAGDFDWFTITVDGASEGDSAEITISGGNINRTIRVQYKNEEDVIEPLDREIFYGTFTLSNNQRTMIVSETGFTYIFTNGSPPTNVQSQIVSWKQVTWTPGNVGSNTGFTANTPYAAWEIECEVEVITSQTKGTQIAQFFGLPDENEDLYPGYRFTVWLLPASGGINVGFINWSPTRTIPWTIFFKQ